MRVIPAVDIRGGKCVNLVQGDYDRETVFSENPVRQAAEWRDSGAEIVHIVDLDGARAGRSCVQPFLERMARDDIPFQIGGGVRSKDTIDELIGLGAQRVVVGSSALTDPDLLAEAVNAYGDRIAVGLDARNGRVALHGWRDTTETGAVEFAATLGGSGVARIIYTDILSDGMMQGPNVPATRRIAETSRVPVTASGGIASLADVRAVAELAAFGVDEMIIGRALYLGAFTLPEAIEAAAATESSQAGKPS